MFETKPEGFHVQVEVAGCYLFIHGELLLLERASHKPEGRCWAVPGGKMEAGESPVAAARRELLEETGIDASPSQFEDLGVVYVRKPYAEFAFHLVHVNLPTRPALTLSDEHLDYAWVAPADFSKRRLILGAQEIFDYFQKRLALKRSEETR